MFPKLSIVDLRNFFGLTTRQIFTDVCIVNVLMMWICLGFLHNNLHFICNKHNKSNRVLIIPNQNQGT